MVSFQCDGCADTVKKPQLDKHRQRCWASFTCLDCSKTFQNQDYKSHTSCISEAEKYQGALYKGPKKTLGAAPTSTQGTKPFKSFTVTPSESPAPSEAAGAGAGAAGIHPSRLNQLQIPEYEYQGGQSGRGRGGFASRGRGGFGGRGFGNNYASPTGENRVKAEGGMRTWGSAPTSDSETPVSAEVPKVTVDGRAGQEGERQARKTRKGDKGGTGSKANSKINSRVASLEPSTIAASSEPSTETGSKNKKRKRDTDDVIADTSSTATPLLSDKTLKKLRKNMIKLQTTISTSVPLAQWLEQVGKGKEKSVNASDVLQGLHVTLVDGNWQLNA